MSITLNLNEQQKIEMLSQILGSKQVIALGTLILDSYSGKVHELSTEDNAIFSDLFSMLSKTYQEQQKSTKRRTNTHNSKSLLLEMEL